MEHHDSLDFRLIGNSVYTLRKKRGLTQEKLAEAADLSAPFVSHVERGTKKASLYSLVRLAAALGVTVDTLLQGKEADLFAAGSEVQNLLDDCSPQERSMLLKIAAAIKQILRETA